MALGNLADIADLLAAAGVIAALISVGYFRSPGQVTRSGRSAQRSGKIQTEKFFLGTRPALPEFVLSVAAGAAR